MGIPSLTKHIREFGETVSLGNKHNGDIPQITSVVIDGPSLVFHIYNTLRSLADTRCNALEAQPTCEEVSIGFLQYIVYLLSVGVQMYVFIAGYDQTGPVASTPYQD